MKKGWIKIVGYVTCIICALIIFVMAILQLSITFGAPFGEYVLGGKYKVLPKKIRVVSITFFFIFIISGIAYLQKGGVFDFNLNTNFVKLTVIVNTVFYGYAIIANGFITKSKKEKMVMTPLSFIQFILSISVLIFT